MNFDTDLDPDPGKNDTGTDLDPDPAKKDWVIGKSSKSVWKTLITYRYVLWVYTGTTLQSLVYN